MNAQPIKDWNEKRKIIRVRISIAEENLEALLLLLYTSIDASDCWTSYIWEPSFQPPVILWWIKYFTLNDKEIKSWILSQGILSHRPDFSHGVLPGFCVQLWDYWAQSENGKLS